MVDNVIALVQGLGPVWALVGVGIAPLFQALREDQLEKRQSTKEQRDFKRESIFLLQEGVMDLRLSLEKLRETERDLSAAASQDGGSQEKWDEAMAVFRTRLEHNSQAQRRVELLSSRVANDALRDSADQLERAARAVRVTIEGFSFSSEYDSEKSKLDERYSAFRKSVSRALAEVQ